MNSTICRRIQDISGIQSLFVQDVGILGGYVECNQQIFM